MQSIHADTTSLTLSPAAAPLAVKGGFDFMGLMPLALIFVVFYFLVFRPQQQKLKQQKGMLEALQRGDMVVTEGGIIGVIHKIVSDKELSIEISDGVVIRVVRSAIAEVISRTSSAGPVEKTKEDKGTKNAPSKVISKKSSLRPKK